LSEKGAGFNELNCFASKNDTKNADHFYGLMKNDNFLIFKKHKQTCKSNKNCCPISRKLVDKALQAKRGTKLIPKQKMSKATLKMETSFTHI